MRNKRGDTGWKGYLFPLILGVIILGLVFYFLFQEYFQEDDINREICRESVILRANIPDIEALEISFLNLRDNFPLKCKTNVVHIDFENKTKAEKLIADEMATCWHLFLEGKEGLFSSGSVAIDSFCVPCARIVFDEDVNTFYRSEKNLLNISDAFKMRLEKGGQTYGEYLKGAFSTFGEDSVIDGDNFHLNSDKINLVSRVFFFYEDAVGFLILPEVIHPDNGDLLIFFQQAINTGNSQDSLLFWFQTAQKSPDPFNEISNGENLVAGGAKSASVCDYFDGIPA